MSSELAENALMTHVGSDSSTGRVHDLRSTTFLPSTRPALLRQIRLDGGLLTLLPLTVKDLVCSTLACMAGNGKGTACICIGTTDPYSVLLEHTRGMTCILDGSTVMPCLSFALRLKSAQKTMSHSHLRFNYVDGRRWTQNCKVSLKC